MEGPVSLAAQGALGPLVTGTGTSSTSESEPGGRRLERLEGAFGGTSEQAVLPKVQAVHRLIWGVSIFSAQMLFLLRQALH